MATPKLGKWEREGWDAAMKKAGGTMKIRTPIKSAGRAPVIESMYGMRLETIYEMRQLLMSLFGHKVVPEDITPEMVMALRKATEAADTRYPWVITTSSSTIPSHTIYTTHGTITVAE